MPPPPPGQYPLAELQAFLSALGEGGIAFLPPDTFAERARAHFAEHAAPAQPAFGLVKLDIHRDIARPLRAARALAAARVPALFLMMHRHPFNDAVFDAPETWEVMSAIRANGHEVGLHIDPFHLIRANGSVTGGLEAALEDFTKHGFPVRAATLHGDTSKHIAACRLNARDFFAEDRDRSAWNGTPPEGEEMLADHVGRYSYAELASRFGIEHLVEAAYRHRGELLAPRLFVYVTDNNRSLQVRNIPRNGGTTGMLDAGPQFRIPAEFAPKALGVLRTHPFLALFHPQWFG